MRGLLASSFMEFGWQCAVWVPILRARSELHSETVIVCDSQYNYLFEDFATTLIHYSKKGLPDRWFLNGREAKVPKGIRLEYSEHKHFYPRHNRIYKLKRCFVPYGVVDSAQSYDLVIHARSEVKYGQNKWNWPLDKYQKVMDRLGNIRACSIGTRAMHIPGTEDLRGIPLNRLCTIMRNSRVTFGPSSGPMHLAMLCQCPVVVMTDCSYQKSVGGTNKDRYKYLWNPFGVTAKVLDQHNWHPPVDLVEATLRRFL